uniref:Uncharacterized protein n=1 Tax=Arundo donax TaxID=35708 RepID=A0A0A9APZ8_ARUDO
MEMGYGPRFKKNIWRSLILRVFIPLSIQFWP